MRVEHTLVEMAQAGDQQGGGWRTDPALAEQVEEALARVPLRRRRVLLGVLDGLTQRQAVINAGYHVGSPQSASQIAQQIMRDPAVQHAYRALLEARGLSGAKLDQIHALHLSRHSSPDGGDRDRSLRALALAHKYLVPRPTPDAKPLTDQLFDEMTPDELVRFAEHGEWPAWAADRLRRAGFTLRRSGAAPKAPEAQGAPDDAEEDVADADPAGDDTPVAALPPESGPRELDETAGRSLRPHPLSPEPDAPPPAPPTASRPPARPPAMRPEDRVWPPPASDRRAAELHAEVERVGEAVVPRDWYKRDCRW